MRNRLLHVFEKDVFYSVDVVARLLHINNMKKIEETCIELEEDGILSQTKGSFALTEFGQSLQYRDKNIKRGKKTHVHKIMANQFKEKETSRLNLSFHIQTYLENNRICTLQQLPN